MKKSYNENKDEDKKLGGNIFKRQETKSPKKKKGQTDNDQSDKNNYLDIDATAD